MPAVGFGQSGVALFLACATSCASPPARSPGPGAAGLQVEAVDGGVINTARYRGKPVVIHLFTTWSLAAQSDVAELQAVHKELGDQVVIIGVALDPDGYRLVAPWRRANALSYFIALASPELMAGHTFLGRITEVPTTVILGRDGRVAYRLSRPLGQGELHQLLAGLR